MFLSPTYVAKHLGAGRFSSVIKAALMGVPIPLCSCGVLPAAALLKKQGANNGATTAFLISTPESGVDSISITWALMDPIMTVARPIAAFLSALVAGIFENLVNPPQPYMEEVVIESCRVDNCCDGSDCPPEQHSNHHSLVEKIVKGMHHAAFTLWSDIASWFFLGILLAGLITVIVPDKFIVDHFSGGISTMLLMLVFGIPLYICATASTPIAAAFILKGMSPGAALVFLLVGPATNITSLSVLTGLLGKRATILYLISISFVSISCGLVLDNFYKFFSISADAVVGHSFEIVPIWLQTCSALILLGLSARPLVATAKKMVLGRKGEKACVVDSCGVDHKYYHKNKCACATDSHNSGLIKVESITRLSSRK